MTNWLLFILGVLSIVFVYVLRPTLAPCNPPTVRLPDGKRITVELAISQEEKSQGLGFRSSLPKNHGMLFLFDSPGIYPFWMKDTLIPLDILWLNHGQIVEITTLESQSSEIIPSHQPSQAADSVLEINAGEAERLGLATGQTLHFTTDCAL